MLIASVRSAVSGFTLQALNWVHAASTTRWPMDSINPCLGPPPISAKSHRTSKEDGIWRLVGSM